MAPRPRRWWLVEGGGKAEDWRPGCTVRAPEAEPSTGGWMMGRRWLPEIPTGQTANISGDGGHDQPASPATEEVKHSPPTSCYIIGKTYRHWLRIIGTQAHRVKLINICATPKKISFPQWTSCWHILCEDIEHIHSYKKEEENFLNFKVKLVFNMPKINQMLCILISESLIDSQSQSASIFMKEACP